MNWFLRVYLEGAVLLTVLSVLGWVCVAYAGRSYSRVRPTRLLSGIRWGSIGLFGVWILAKALPVDPIWEPTSQSLGGEIVRGLAMKVPPPPADSPAELTLSTTSPQELIGILLLIFVVFGLIPWARLFLLRSRLRTVRKVGAVRVAYRDSGGPFSFWLPGEAWVVLPQWTLQKPEFHRVVLSHELQHHRQGDTWWRHASVALKAAYPWLLHWRAWDRIYNEISEFACDEALIRGRVSPQTYGCCLLEAAQQLSYVGDRGPTALAAGLQPKQLKRRVSMLFNYKSSRDGRAGLRMMGLMAVTLVGATSWALSGTLHDRSVSMKDAREMVQRVQGDFPVDLNPQVLQALNRFVGTPDGRRYIRESTKRMKSYSGIVEPLFAQYQAPEELHAVAIMESGYQNLPSSVNPVRAAGVWQFIKGTARNFGLAVNNEEDERLDVALETDAALRYLFSNYYRFQDWRLAILAYNAGENRVQRGIRATGKRDPWALIEAGYGGDKGYLAKVMAGVIILSNLDRI